MIEKLRKCVTKTLTEFRPVVEAISDFRKSNKTLMIFSTNTRDNQMIKMYIVVAGNYTSS
jgi:hypothetical protein